MQLTIMSLEKLSLDWCSKSGSKMFLLVFIICICLSEGSPKIVYVKENQNHELSYLFENPPKNEQQFVWVKDSDKNVHTICDIYLLECIHHDRKSWVQATVERVNTSLLFRLLLMNITKEKVDGIWKLMSHITMPYRRLYYSQEIRVYEIPKNLACFLSWTAHGLNATCRHHGTFPKLKMALIWGPNRNRTAINQTTERVDAANNTASYFVLIPIGDLIFGNLTLTLSMYPNLTNSKSDKKFRNNFDFSVTIENPVVELMECSAPTDSTLPTVCTCYRRDSSDVPTELIWMVNTVIPKEQPGIIIREENDGFSEIRLNASITVTRISCLAKNKLGWLSPVEVKLLEVQDSTTCKGQQNDSLKVFCLALLVVSAIGVLFVAFVERLRNMAFRRDG